MKKSEEKILLDCPFNVKLEESLNIFKTSSSSSPSVDMSIHVIKIILNIS